MGLWFSFEETAFEGEYGGRPAEVVKACKRVVKKL
jgi:hypothetical protein